MNLPNINILFEKKAVKMKETNSHKPKYWKSIGKKDAMGLNIKANIGSESVYIIVEPTPIP